MSAAGFWYYDMQLSGKPITASQAENLWKLCVRKPFKPPPAQDDLVKNLERDHERRIALGAQQSTVPPSMASAPKKC